MFSKANLSAPRCQSLTKNLYQKLEMDCRSPDVWTQVKQFSSSHQVSLGGTERPFQAGNYLSADSYPRGSLLETAAAGTALPCAARGGSGGGRRLQAEVPGRQRSDQQVSPFAAANRSALLDWSGGEVSTSWLLLQNVQPFELEALRTSVSLKTGAVRFVVVLFCC